MAKKRWYSNSLLLILVLGGCFTATAQVQLTDFKYLDQLEGSWVMRTRQSIIAENWTRLNDSCWQGHSWRIVGKDSTLEASMELLRSADGIYFIPLITGQSHPQALRLKVRVLKPIGFVAENLSYDFPQKVIYRFKGSDQLDARFYGKQQGTSQEIIFQYEKE